MSMNFTLKNEYITLSQLLKACDIVDSGGMIKAYLSENYVLVNGEKENRRGRKLYAGDCVELEDIRIDIE
jgi:ribosome-associated protein